MKNLRGCAGFALIESLIIHMIFVIVLLGVVGIVFIGGVARGNYWVGEASALKAVQRVDSGMTELIVLERHIWKYSKATVRDKDGKEFEFAIDANILQNRRARPWD